MDHVLHELRDNDSFKSGSSPEKEKQLHGSAVMATSQDHTEAVPDRDGGSTASTSDSDDL